MTEWSEDAPLGEVINWLEEHLAEGADCPACGQRAQLYRRKLDSGMARVLIQMYTRQSKNPDRWVHVPSLGTSGGDPIKTRHWDLIEKRDDVRDDGSPRAGWWRLTDLGVQFVQGRTRIPKYAYLYNGICVRLDADETISVQDALADRFNYDELMSGGANA